MRNDVMSKANKEQSDELKHLAEKADADINTKDIPEIRDWSEAKHGQFYRPIKQQVTLRLDADMLAWFRAQGRKYQTRMNAALREYMERHRGER